MLCCSADPDSAQAVFVDIRFEPPTPADDRSASVLALLLQCLLQDSKGAIHSGQVTAQADPDYLSFQLDESDGACASTCLSARTPLRVSSATPVSSCVSRCSQC